MQLSDFRKVLAQAGDVKVEFVLPDGACVPTHYHVTEVGYVVKDFFDCGGVRREERYCSLQLWVANDTDHALTASKILSIIKHTEQVIPPRDLDVIVEYQRESLALYGIGSANRILGKLIVSLSPVSTNCLAPDRCGVGSSCC